MATPMTTSRSVGFEAPLIIESTTVNAVNNTSGGAILQFNGSPTPADYDQIGKIVSSGSNGRIRK